MKKFIVIKTGVCCKEHGYYVEIKSVNNDGEECVSNVYKKDFEHGYFKTELDAWRAYRENLKNQVRRWERTIENLNDGIDKAELHILALTKNTEE
jgi:hypothetical protein